MPLLPEYHPFRSQEAKEKFLALYKKRSCDWPLASDEKTVETAYGPTFMRISGSAENEPVVLLHGFGCNALMWRPNVAAWSEQFRTIAIDCIYDYGLSVWTQPLKTVQDLTAWLDDLLEALDLKKVHVVGLSYGGWLAAQYALHYPQRTGRLVMIAPGATVMQLNKSFLARIFLSFLPFRGASRRLMRWLFADMAQTPEGLQAVTQWADDVFLAARCFAPKRVPPPAVLKDAQLKKLPPRTLFVAGENEKIYSAEKAGARLKETAPDIKTVIIPGAGHDLTFVKADAVNRHVLDFLNQP